MATVAESRGYASDSFLSFSGAATHCVPGQERVMPISVRRGTETSATTATGCVRLRRACGDCGRPIGGALAPHGDAAYLFMPVCVMP
jgi:hypothetical protein